MSLNFMGGIVATLVMDILYTLVDPRVKSSIIGGSKKAKKKGGKEAA